jgi:hypothetical protein
MDHLNLIRLYLITVNVHEMRMSELFFEPLKLLLFLLELLHAPELDHLQVQHEIGVRSILEPIHLAIHWFNLHLWRGGEVAIELRQSRLFQRLPHWNSRLLTPFFLLQPDKSLLLFLLCLHHLT